MGVGFERRGEEKVERWKQGKGKDVVGLRGEGGRRVRVLRFAVCINNCSFVLT